MWIGGKRDAGLADVFEFDEDFLPVAKQVVRCCAGDETLFDAAEVEIASVAEEFGAVRFVADLDVVTL